MKHQTSAPDLHQGAEGGLCSGSGLGRLGSGRSRPGSAHGTTKSVHGRPGSGRGRPRSAHGRTGSECGLHTPGGGNVKIFSKRLPDFSHIHSRVDSSPPAPKESAMPQVSAMGRAYGCMYGVCIAAVLCCVGHVRTGVCSAAVLCCVGHVRMACVVQLCCAVLGMYVWRV